MRIYSFPPAASPDACILILGSMPGQASLDANQYYAHPRNIFWPLMGTLVGAGPDQSYERRISILKKHRIAVWDVLQSCTREGSLDSAIENETPNDFGAFFNAHSGITHVFFNGGKAHQAFRRHIGLSDLPGFTVLPSTSPAYAAKSFAEKLEEWSAIRSRLRLPL